MKSLILLISILLITVINIFAQEGTPDSTFGGGDGLTYHYIFPDKPSQGYGIAMQQDQKIVVSGTTTGPDGHGHAFLCRYSEDGSLDNSFNGSGIITIDLPGNSASCAVKLQADDKIIICVPSEDSTGQYASVFRFNADGVPDNSFDGDGHATILINSEYMDLSTMALQPDGKILVGGYAGGFWADSFLVIRFLANGVLDQSFGGDGIVITGVGEDYTDVNSLVVQPDGKILATGYATFNGNEDFAIVRYNSDGTLDDTFSGDGIANVTVSNQDDRIYSALIQPDSKIVVGGYGHNNITGYESFALARLNTDGTPDSSFHADGIAVVYITNYNDKVLSILRQPDGKYVLAGSINGGDPNYGFVMALARVTADGVLDHTFDDDGFYMYPLQHGLESQINACTLQPDGKVISTGNYRVDPLNQVMVFRTLTGLTTANKEVQAFAGDVSIYPNPVTENVVINYSLEKTESLRITLCDVMGRSVDHLLSKVQRSAGFHEEHLMLGYLVPGNYFVKMETSAGVKAIPIVKE